MVRGVWGKEQRARSKEHGARSTVQGAWGKEQRARSREHGARSKEQGAWGKEQRARSMMLIAPCSPIRNSLNEAYLLPDGFRKKGIGSPAIDEEPNPLFTL
jgi:hypothetical protein